MPPAHLSRNAIITLTLIMVLLLLAGLATYHIQNAERQRQIEAGRDINQLALEDGASPFRDIYGRPYAIPAHEDAILIVTSWASWCASCAEDLSRFEKVAASYGDQVAVLAVNRKEPDVMVRDYAKRFSEFKSVTLVLDERDHFFHAVDGQTIPETIFYDYEGEVFRHARASLSNEQIVAIIKEIQGTNPAHTN